MRILLSSIYIFSLISCTSSKIVSNYNSAEKLPQIYLLSERFTSCKESIAFMKSIIKPTNNGTKFRSNLEAPVIGIINLNILNDTNKTKIKNLHLFYIDLSCLKSLNVQELMEILLSDEKYKEIMTLLDSEKGRNGRFIFEGGFNGFTCFTLIINKNAIEGFEWCIEENSHEN
jgi:hypothetical protein